LTNQVYLDYIDKGVPMRKRQVIQIFFVSLTGISLISLLSAPIKQVRVIADRASIYSEPNRSSARIEVVEKGTILTLFQQNKVRDVWYYVSYESPRYGARISGFIHESAVEPVQEEPTPSPAKKMAEPEKLGPLPGKALTAPAKAEKETKAEPTAPPRIEEALVASRIPKSKVIKLPPQLPQLKDASWKPAVPIIVTKLPEKKEVPVKETKPAIPIEIMTATPLPRSRAVKLPAKEKAREDIAWKIIQPAAPVKKPEALPPPPPAIKKEKPQLPSAEPRQVKAPPREEPKKGQALFALGLGYGPSLGGAGAFFQLNTKAGFALHGGLGYYPTTLIYSETDWVKNKILYSVGVKYYLPFNSSFLFPYVDLQYGGLRVEAAQIVLGVWEYTYVLGHEQKTLWGPSALAGAELRKGRLGLNGAVGVSYALTEWEYINQKVFLSFDFSFLVYF
jgi:hypothetical protein